MRDVRMILEKLRFILNPKVQKDKAKQLKNWDLWGPLLFCLTLALYIFLNFDNTFLQ